MGWTFMNRPAGTVEEIVRQHVLSFSHVPEEQRPEIVATARNGNCLAFALRLPVPYLDANQFFREVYTPANDGTITAAAVILVRCPAGQFGYKDMTETMGPYETVGPAFLTHLSPIRPDATSDSAQWARDWRERCRTAASAKATARRAAAKVTAGTRLRFPEPLTFKSGAKYSEFVAVTRQTWRRGKMVDSIAYRAPDGALCALPKSLLVRAEILDSAPPKAADEESAHAS